MGKEGFGIDSNPSRASIPDQGFEMEAGETSSLEKIAVAFPAGGWHTRAP